MKIKTDILIKKLYERVEQGDYCLGLISYGKEPRRYGTVIKDIHQRTVAIKDWNCMLRINLWFLVLRFTWIKINKQQEFLEEKVVKINRDY